MCVMYDCNVCAPFFSAHTMCEKHKSQESMRPPRKSRVIKHKGQNRDDEDDDDGAIRFIGLQEKRRRWARAEEEKTGGRGLNKGDKLPKVGQSLSSTSHSFILLI